ncbi:MAG: type IV pilus modification PilV family protein [Gammaproteobacteria bacterium]
MNSVDYRTTNKGIGLIEVLVSLAVIALGLMAVASMQGNFLSSSGNSKTRAEAQALAEEKIEELRNYIILNGVNDEGDNIGYEINLPLGVSEETVALGTQINGVNAVFERNWTITNSNVGSVPKRTITVRVDWDQNKDGAINFDVDPIDPPIILTSEIAFSNPAASVALANAPDDGTGSFGEAPSPGQSASETVDDKEVELKKADGTLNDGVSTTEINGYTFYLFEGNYYRLIGGSRYGEQVFLCNTLSQFEIDLSSPKNYDPTTLDPLYDFDPLTGTFSPFNAGDDLAYLYTIRRSLDGVAGNEVIELFTQNFVKIGAGNNISYDLDGTCTREHRFFGGIIHPIKGTVHTLFNLDDIKIDHNKEDMFCTFDPGSGHTTRHYACYVGGDCDVSVAGDEADVTQCPNPVAADAKVGPGGFSGNVGLINVDDDGPGKESVCFEEDLDGTSTNFATARKYKTLNAGHEQGINGAYSCQNFFIVGRQANLNKLSAECSAKAGVLNLAPKEIVRTINGPNTVVTTINENYCGDRVLETYPINISFEGGVPSVNGVKTLSGAVCVVNGATASCSETTYGKTARIYAKNDNQSGTCTISPLSLVAENSCTIELVATPTYILNGTLTGAGNDPDMHVEDSFGNTGICSIVGDTFSCTIGTSDTTITIQSQKIAGNKITVLDYCTKVVAPNGGDNGTNTYSNVCSLVKK